MGTSNRNLFLVAAGIGLMSIWGCQDGPRPMAPTHAVSLSVDMPLSDEVKAALAGSDTNEILYAVRNATGITEKGKLKASTVSNPDGSGSVQVSLNIVGQDAVLSLQLNSASTHQPLAIGASYLQFTPTRGKTVSGSVIHPPYKGKPTLTLDMGALNTNCSTFYHNGVSSGSSMNFMASLVNYNYQDDCFVENVYINDSYAGTELMDSGCVSIGCQNNIAYLGNGDLVDYAYVPADSKFFPYSTQSKMAVLSVGKAQAVMQVGDVYCVKLTSYVGGHAWVQVTNIYDSDGTSVSFRFRANSYYPFYGLEQTPCYNW